MTKLRGVGKGPGAAAGLRARLKKKAERERRRAREVARGTVAKRPMWHRGPGRRVEVDPLEGMAAQGFGSLPERILEYWLRRRGYQYDRQVPELGGMTTGGAIIDFVVYGLGSQLVALRINGRWTHRDRQLMDEHQRVRLRMRGYRVVDLWDDDLLAAARGHRLGGYVLGEVQRQG